MPVRCLIDISQSFSRRYCPILPVIANSAAEACSMSRSTPASASSAMSGLFAERQQHLLLPLELLQQVGLEVGAAGHLEDLEQVSSAMWWSGGSLRAMKWRERSNRSSSRSSVRMRSLSGYSYVIICA